MGKAGTLGFLVKRLSSELRKAREKVAQALPFAAPAPFLRSMRIVKIGNSHEAGILAKEMPMGEKR
jgi:hypothetical protein